MFGKYSTPYKHTSLTEVTALVSFEVLGIPALDDGENPYKDGFGYVCGELLTDSSITTFFSRIFFDLPQSNM